MNKQEMINDIVKRMKRKLIKITNKELIQMRKELKQAEIWEEAMEGTV